MFVSLIIAALAAGVILGKLAVAILISLCLKSIIKEIANRLYNRRRQVVTLPEDIVDDITEDLEKRGFTDAAKAIKDAKNGTRRRHNIGTIEIEDGELKNLGILASDNCDDGCEYTVYRFERNERNVIVPCSY